MRSRTERLLIALVFALFAAGLTLIAASAKERDTEASTNFTSDCAVCHTEYQMIWESGAHGQAAEDPAFVAEWTAQGKPGACLVCHTTGYDPATASYDAAGVTCEACHGPANPDHPKTPMPVDRTTDLCGRCHSDTRFGWQDWKVSTHYQRGMDCATCHDPHSASLKSVSTALDGSSATDEISLLCINCHKEHSMDFPYTSHHEKGISCVDCHVNHLENEDRTAHTVPDHSFNASLKSCNTCHAGQMHGPTEALSPEDGEQTVALPDEEIVTSAIMPEPDPVSPMGFSALAGLVGLAGGMVLAPWLERWYARIAKHTREEDHE